MFVYIQKLLLIGIFAIFFAFGFLFNLNTIVYGQLDQQQESVSVLSSSEYQDDAGYYHIIGEVENNSPDSREFIKVTASLYDSTNRIVETVYQLLLQRRGRDHKDGIVPYPFLGNILESVPFKVYLGFYLF